MPDPWLPVPHSPQERPHSCLPACVRQVLAYLGRTVSESELDRLFEAEDFGVPGHRLQRLTRWGYRVQYRPISEAKLHEFLDRQVPVIALVRTEFLDYWREDVYHAVVLVGSDDSGFYLNDPQFYEALQRVARDAFLAAWIEMDCLSGIIES
jgi:ABC-type bacteriocin/lantibiotic exporter with double-glycine peptidase domain